MAIKYKLKDIVAIYYGSQPISKIYHGTQLVWQAIRSCFGAGYWRGDKPWNNEESWKG